MIAKANLVILACALGFLALFAGTRSPAYDPEPLKRIGRRVEVLKPSETSAPEPELRTTVSDEDRVQEDLSESLGFFLEGRKALGRARYREVMLGAAADYLGMSDEEEAAFSAGSQASAREIELAWQARDQTFLTLPEGLPEEDRLRLEQEAHDRYVDSKRRALERLERSLGPGDRRARFAARLEEWIDYLIER